MSQFRITGTNYVSQWDGDDINAGTSPTLPKKTIGSAGTPAAIGAGQYTQNLNALGSRNWTGDGKVIVNGNNTIFQFASIHIHNNIHFRNVQSSNNASNVNLYGTDSIYEGFAIPIRNSTSGANVLRRALILGTGAGFTGLGGGRIFNSLVLGNTYVAGAGSIYAAELNYFAKTQPLVFDATGQARFLNNYVNGLVTISGVVYEAKKLPDGSTRPDPTGGIPDIDTIWANFYTNGNSAVLEDDLKIIDIYSKTVEPDSILLSKTGTYGYIGGVKVGRKIDLDESGFTITKTGIDDSNPNFWKIAVGVDYAKIRITGKVSDSLISAQTLDIRIPFNFDGDAVGGTADNNNVPDAWNARTTPDTKGELPNRLTFEVRSSQLTNPGRDVSADWDNDNTNNPSIAGQYYLMEYGQPMLHHVISAVAYGNADASAINAATKLPFNYRSLDIIITITNTREI